MSDRERSDLEQIAESDTRSGWLMTYADLVTLILVFFVLLFSISKMNLGKLTETLKSMEITMGTETPKTRLFDVIDTSSLAQSKMLDHLTGMRGTNIFREINNLIHRRNLTDAVETEMRQGKIVLRIEGKVLFNSGSAELLSGAAQILGDIIQILKDNPQYRVDIQGHTDNRPIHTSRFTSNWELSAIRATTVLRHLIEEGISEQRLTATGFADRRPLAANNTEEGRRKNRRVEFVLKEN
ncbi:MAG: OmpA/MotB family protein [Thermodesulfobacteriota bacterium]